MTQSVSKIFTNLYNTMDIYAVFYASNASTSCSTSTSLIQ